MLAPGELVQLALDVGLTALAVTDHDSTEALAAALGAAEGTGLTLVPGVELSVDVPDGEVHILGYFVDAASAALQSRLQGLRDGRLRRGERIVERLASAGVVIELARVLAIADGGAVGRPHVARALIEAGHATSIDDAFDRYLVRGKPGYVERQRFTPREAVETILAAGGVPALAHPLHGVDPADASADETASPDMDASTVERRVGELAAVGLRGLEVYYGGYDAAAIGFLEGLTQRHRLIPTGGSDFHGPGRAALGSVAMPVDAQATVVERLRGASSTAHP